MRAVIQVKNLKKYFPIVKGIFKKRYSYIRAVDDVSFSIEMGETFGLVGESGSGKSTIARLLLRLIEPTDGEILFKGKDITKLNKEELREVRKNMGIVFQDPASSLNPRNTVYDTLLRPLKLHGIPKDEGEERIHKIMKSVNLGEELLGRYPHQLSGGQQQRVSIARAIILNPDFVVLDEPTSALDVSVQAQILNLLLDLQREFRLTYLFISHDLSVVRYISDRIGVMYLGNLFEIAPTEKLYSHAFHPYTVGLVSSAPILNPRLRSRKKLLLSGEPPSLINPPSGCPLHPRCPFAKPICKEKKPRLIEVEEDHFVACHRTGEIDFSEFLGGEFVG